MLSITLTAPEQKLIHDIIENAPPGRPYSLSEVRRGVELIRKLDEARASNPEAALLLLEKDEHAFLKARLDQPQWLRAGQDILDLYDKIERAQDVKVQPAARPNGAHESAAQ